MKPRVYLLVALAAALFQIGALAKMIVDRNRLMTSGTEVMLETGFIDPRDLFRGHYVTLELEISRLSRSDVSAPPQEPETGDPVWVSLAPGEDGFWRAVALHTQDPDAVAIKGEWRFSSTSRYGIDFPIDRFFAPKLRAQELEQYRRDRALGVIVALDDTGLAALKGITVEGDAIYEEPLF